MVTLEQMMALNGSLVRMDLTDGTSINALVVDVQDNLRDQVAFEVQDSLTTHLGGARRLKAGRVYAVSLEDIKTVDKLS